MNLYEGYQFYGPYIGEDNRLRIVCVLPNGVHTSLSYPKYKMEIKLGRYLLPNEKVHHKDDNPLNNDYDNLQVLNATVHRKLQTKVIEEITITCTLCGTQKKLTRVQTQEFHKNRNRRRTGPFCSRRCVGIYGQRIQAGMAK